MTFALSARATSSGYRLAAYDTIGSTNAEAMALAAAGEAGPLWVVSDCQTDGRGRRGSRWDTPRGNLAASLLLTSEYPAARIATLGFVAGLALDRAIGTCCTVEPPIGAACDDAPGSLDRLSLKWPNDVLVDGAKLAGILLGSEDVAPGRRAVVIGFGVNVAHAPQDLPYRAASLARSGCGTDATKVFAALSAAWVDMYGMWAGESGFAAVRRLWLQRAAGLGGAVAVRTGAGVTRGIFETIDERGQLVIRAPDGSARIVSAGEVHFGVAASAPRELRA